MQTEYLIAVNEFCVSHDIEISFISSLKETGLIETTTIEDTVFIDAEQLQQLEKYIRFYYELNINLEGIETIKHLLLRVNVLHEEITALKNRLRLYENGFH
ncbi:MAG: chaperone modulator CbpM [Bacteroidota bacterium]|nr:MerR family transcriptional regulator [Odoribacter sp.]MDP3642448.1 chaperone modulator CbpM [Bacteroidota bacterium]